MEHIQQRNRLDVQEKKQKSICCDYILNSHGVLLLLLLHHKLRLFEKKKGKIHEEVNTIYKRRKEIKEEAH